MFHFPEKHTQGVSLIIAIIFVSALMLITAGLAETTYNAYKNIQNYMNFSRAETASETLAREAKFLADQYSAGWSSTGSWKSGDPLPSGNTPLGFVLSSVLDNLKDMKGACAQVGPGGAVEPCGDISFRYDVIGNATEPLAFPGVTGDAGYPPMLSGDCSLGNFDDRANCYYTVPAPIFIDRDLDGQDDVIEGTGDLTEKCLDIDGDGDIDDTDKLNGDNPCHWNKLEIGKLIEIPLYYTDSEGNIVNPSAAGNVLTEFKLRVRTPCQFSRSDGSKYYDPDQWCESTARVQLYPEDRSGIPCDPDNVRTPIPRDQQASCKARTSRDDKQLVRWEIATEDSITPGTTYSLLAMDDPVASYISEWQGSPLRRRKIPTRLSVPTNTEIYASKITKKQFAGPRVQDAILLQESDIGLDADKFWDTIDRFYKVDPARNRLDVTGAPSSDCPGIGNWNCRSVTKPKLRLELIYRPRISDRLVDDLDTTPQYIVPFLEYQILTNRPIGDEKKTIRTEARVSGTGSSTKTKIYNPVIQQSFVVEN